MRFREVFRYELAYRFRSGSTWFYAGYLFLIMLWGVAAMAGDVEAVHANAPAEVARATVLFGGLFSLLVSAALFSDAAIRDFAAGMDPLLFTTRLRKTEFLGGRFLAALAVNAIILLALPIGHAVALTLPFVPAEALGPFRLATYLQPLLLFLLPNLLLVGAILFTIAALSRRALPVYLGALGVFIGYLVAANYWSRIDSPVLSVLADPLAIVSMVAATEYWSPAQKNSQLIGLPALLVGNRLLWLAVALTLLTVLHRTFRFAHATAEGRRGLRTTEPVIAAGAPRTAPVVVPRVAGSFGLRMRVSQTLTVARQGLADVLGVRGLLLTLGAAIGGTMLWGWNAGDTVFESSIWPVTHLVTQEVLSERVILVPLLLIVFVAGELVWKHRDVKTAEITDAMPVPDGVALGGRLLALVALIAVLQTAFMAGGILLQTLQGYYNFEPGLYVRILFGLNLTYYVLLAVLALTVHVLVNHKYIGHIVALLAIVFTYAAGALGLGHKLLVYGKDPGWSYSDMNGFGPYIGPVVWFRSYWAAWAILLLAVAVLFWVRGREPELRRRIADARARFVGPVVRSAAVAVLLIVGLGGFIFYNTNILNDYRGRDEIGRPLAEYEKRYRRFENAPQPTIAGAQVRIEIYPDQRALDLRGSYQLVNRTDRAIDSVHVVVTDRVEGRAFSFDRGARTIVDDRDVGYRIFALERPLAPGDSLRLTFDVTHRRRGFTDDRLPTDVASNGAYFDRRWLPYVGYQPSFELRGEARKRFGLAPQPMLPGVDDPEATRFRFDGRDAARVPVSVVVGTSADQTAVSSGVLRRSWMENGRRYVQYDTEVPTSFGMPVFSARYAILEDQWNGVKLRIFRHPAHGNNQASMVHGMKAALDYCASAFGPYPYSELRIVEVPPYEIFGRAHAGMIAFSENAFLTRQDTGVFDQAFYGTAHEVAHQWWGGQVRGALVKGHAFLSESLANYSAMMVTERTFGPEAARQVYDFQMDRYLRGRAEYSREVPLLDVADQPYIYYRRGAVAMYTLREFIGAERVNAVLRRFVEKHRAGLPPHPTSHDLYADLRAATPDSLHSLLSDLFETATLWSVRTTRAVVDRTGAGEYRVTMDVVARKTRADSIGVEREVPMDDLVEIGVFAAGKEDRLGEPLYMKRHRIRGGKQTISVTVPRQPARAGVDPWRKLIDRERGDNVVDVRTADMEPVALTRRASRLARR